MKVVLLLCLFCLTEAADLRWEVNEMFKQLKSSMEEKLNLLEGQNTDLASRLSASETRWSESEKLVEELQRSKAEMSAKFTASETLFLKSQVQFLQIKLSSSDYQHQVQLLQNKLSSSDHNVEPLKKECQEMAAKLSASEKELKDLQTKLCSTEKQVQVHHIRLSSSDNNVEALKKECGDMAIRLSASETRLSASETKIEELQRHKADWTEEKNNLVKDLGHLQSRYDNVTAQMVQTQSSYDQLQSSYDQLLSIYNAAELKRRLCGPGWHIVGSSCYFISTEKRTWDQSRQWCRDKQSDLIIINNKEEQDFVKRGLDHSQQVWLGLTDRVTDGEWKWVDGTPLTTPTYWYSSQPDGGGGQACAGHQTGYGWWDEPCTNRIRWICEKVV